MFSQRFGAAFAAAGAMAAPARRIDRDAVADAEAGAPAVDLDDLAGDLVAKHQRRGDDEVAGPRMAEIVQVGAADAAGAEADAHHAGRERPERAFDHAQVLRPEQRRGECSIGHRISPICVGSQSVIAGTKVIRISATNSGTSQGRIAMVVRSTDSLATRDSTNSTMPSGG